MLAAKRPRLTEGRPCICIRSTDRRPPLMPLLWRSWRIERSSAARSRSGPLNAQRPCLFFVCFFCVFRFSAAAAAQPRQLRGLLGVYADLLLDLPGESRIGLQQFFGLLAALAQFRLAVGEERTALGDDLQLGADVENVAGLADALIIHDVEFGFADRV